MSDTNKLYTELKPDLQQLAEALLGPSEYFVRKRGGFLPHGAALTAAGEVRPIMAAPEDLEKDVSSLKVLPLLHQALRQTITTEDTKAVAVAEDVRIKLDGGSETAAMKVLIEHVRGLCIAYYVPYSRSFFRRCRFGEMFAKSAQPEVGGWGS